MVESSDLERKTTLDLSFTKSNAATIDMAIPIRNIDGADNVETEGRRIKKVEKGQEGSRNWKKLKFFSCCFAFGSTARDSIRGKNNENDDEVVRHAVQLSSRPPTKINSEINYYPHLQQFTFHQLMLATNNFKHVIGEGGFGKVYKGLIINNGSSLTRLEMKTAVAIKTLNIEGKQGHKEWVAEINHLGALRHPNLVKLFGYCIEGEQRVLVYEFMSKGSLENHIFRKSAVTLPWTTRMKIMLGAAKGLAFLHEEAQKPLIFRDFKTSNILLDLHYNAKLSDFGFARDAPVGDLTHVSTRIMGTQGYAAPEYVLTGHLTSKSDVYSFGVVLLEMLTGRKANDKRRSHKEHNLVNWAKPFLKHRGGFYQLMDPRFNGQYSRKGTCKAMTLVTCCLHNDQNSRPLMSKVVQVMRSVLNNNDIPNSLSPPSFKGFHVGTSSSAVNKYGLIVGSSSTSTPSRFQDFPLSFTPPFRSPKPSSEKS